jgi:broad specificity phosphatase PhoE
MLKYLEEIDVGLCEGLTWDELHAGANPYDFDFAEQDKLHYRFPRGESYQDLIYRLEPVVFEIERTKHPVIVLSHCAVLRCLKAYLAGT